MDLRGILLSLSITIMIGLKMFCVANGNNLVFQVERRKTSLTEIKDHDARRRGRFLSTVDLNLGGNGLPTKTGLYYTKLALGSPKKDYYVQVDTGSDIMWVNCVECSRCPKKSDIGIDLTFYDPKGSMTSELIFCDHEFCSSTYDGPIPGCKAETPCPYSITYGDGSATTGYYVRDFLTFNRVNGNRQTAPQNSSIVFGCGAVQSGTLGSSPNEALDGILGLGQANSSVLSQLAASGKVKKIFSHCLDTVNGGGIFAIGELVEPKISTTTPLVPNMAHYNVVLKNIEVDGDVLELPSDVFDSGNGKGTVIDSGTTLAYLPGIVYDQLIPKVFARQHGLRLYLVDEQFKCFPYNGNVDGNFPVVKLHFEDSLSLTVYPHSYLFAHDGLIIHPLLTVDFNDGLNWHLENFTDTDRGVPVQCIGWQKSVTQTKDGKDMTLLGDLVLSNKLVLYDLENMVIGWTDYNCSSSIKVKDATTGIVHIVGAHNISSASTFLIGRSLTLFLLLTAMLNGFIN